MAYSSTLSTRMWNCSVSCSAALLGNFLDIRLRREFSNTIRAVPLIRFPPQINYFLEKYTASHVAAMPVAALEPIATAVHYADIAFPRAKVFLFRLLYFRLREDLDLDVEEEEGCRG